MKVLLIGGSGAIGTALVPYFDINGYEIQWCNSKQFPLPAIADGWGDMDVVINLAALTVECERDKFNVLNKKLIDVNCLGAVNILANFLPGMREQCFGRIILFSSVYSAINVKGQGVYSASKAFVDKIVKIAALENAEYGITVNSIQLGYTGTGMGESTRENKQKARNNTALKRFVTIEEIYRTVDYIINTEYLTGQNIRLDGGIR